MSDKPRAAEQPAPLGPPPVPGVSWHAMERAEQYHGPISREEWLVVMMDLLERRTVLARKMPHGSEHHWATIPRADGTILRLLVVYRTDCSVIVTTLPPAAKRLMLRKDMKAGKRAPRIHPCQIKSRTVQGHWGRGR